ARRPRRAHGPRDPAIGARGRGPRLAPRHAREPGVRPLPARALPPRPRPLPPMTAGPRLAALEARLRARELPDSEPWLGDRAAVAAILRESATDLEALLIRRAEREDDPWSGHMAFPGGRRGAADRDIEETARRETLEEIGLDLA